MTTIHQHATWAGSLQIRAEGTPAPQGSKQAMKVGRKIVVIEGDGDRAKRHKAWRNAIIAAAKAAHPAGHKPLDGPLHLQVDFYRERPAGHFGTGRNAGILKETAPDHPDTAPDLDKLVRSVGDALKLAGTIHDDARIVFTHSGKHYADGRPPGADITITPLSAIG